MEHFDLIVIGGGPAGEKAAARAAYFKKKVAIVEKEKDLGGAGVHTGTLPSKTLKETALFLSGKSDKGLFGVDKDLKRDVSIEDFFYRKNYVINSETEAIQKNIINHNVKVIKGSGRFVDKNTISVINNNEEIKISANYILISTGSYPFHPKEIPFDYDRIHDSDSILNLKRYPRSLCVLGGGVIGCEYTTIFSAQGIHVTLIDGRNYLLPFLDQEISDSLVNIMRKDGVDVIFNDIVKEIHVPKNESEDLTIILFSGKKIQADMFLFAAGRSGRISGLGLEEVGVKFGKRETIEVNEKYQTNIPNIFAAGDVIGFPSLASTSMDQGRAAVTHMFSTSGFSSIAKIFPYGIYTIPEISMVGITEQDAIKDGIEYSTGIARYKDMARGKILGSKEGYLKIVFDKTNLKILGIHIIGPLATEIIHFGLAAIETNKTLEDLISVIYNYPTLHDLYKYAAFDGLGNVFGNKIRKFDD
jgi:NAD(P) transhydrogenase